MTHCQAASWQRRCQRWLANSRIDSQGLYGPLILWAIQHWQKPGQTLHLALDITMLCNRFCVVMVSVMAHGRAIPLLWQMLDHPSASVSSTCSIALLEKVDRLLPGFETITLLADRALTDRHISETHCKRKGLNALGGQGAMRVWGCSTKPIPRGFPHPPRS